MCYVNLTCPSCGAAQENPGSRDSFLCPYCGSRIEREKTHVEATFKGPAGEGPLLERAFLFLEDGDYTSAERYLEKVLDLAPKCAMAYIGKLMCALRCRTLEELTGHRFPLTRYDLYGKAIRFAQPEELERIEGLNQTIIDRLAQTRKTMGDAINDIHRQILSGEAYLAEHKSAYQRCAALNLLWTVLFVAACLVATLIIMGAIATQTLGMLLLAAPFLGLMVLFLLLKSRVRKDLQSYRSVRSATEDAKKNLAARQQAFQFWQANNRF